MNANLLNLVFYHFNQQLLLSIIGACFGILVGLPLALAIAWKNVRWRALSGFAEHLAWISPLALLPILHLWLGPSLTSLVLIMTLFTASPILQQTLAGLNSVNPKIQLTADSLGLGAWHRLSCITFPLAMPSVIHGIRLASMRAVGVATIASFLWGGGLGELIATAMKKHHTELLLTSSLAVIAMTLLVDFFWYFFEKKAKNKHSFRVFRALVPALLGAVIFVIALYFFSLYVNTLDFTQGTLDLESLKVPGNS